MRTVRADAAGSIAAPTVATTRIDAATRLMALIITPASFSYEELRTRAVDTDCRGVDGSTTTRRRDAQAKSAPEAPPAALSGSRAMGVKRE
ncbi:hypothetical protein AFL01nite_27060 [Aeromicrobium flavum]|uniref:Uncharacterized protein n=1 Tax=Aeromicrobium flavum TaxID=416568 RepID=A0A512HY43_9ACTN|nr:hypothetical protein AFL01nite_27060 [Aeromicrobium flavum]